MRKANTCHILALGITQKQEKSLISVHSKPIQQPCKALEVAQRHLERIRI